MSARTDGTRSISDDDLCGDCAHCVYQPGEESYCAMRWPGDVDADGYIRACKEFSKIGQPTANWSARAQADLSSEAAEPCDLYALVYGDYALYGASPDDSACDFYGYWNVGGSLEDLGEWELILLKDVPAELAEQLEVHGTSEQHFSDGYEAWQECIPYISGVVDSGNTEEEE